MNKTIKEVAVSKLVTAAALTTFGLWATKILANIFMSHLYLATEQRTMIHTGLALTREGQGLEKEDRQPFSKLRSGQTVLIWLRMIRAQLSWWI